MTPVELTRQGFKALVDSLGYVDAVRFLRQFDLGRGDYTKERHQWLDRLTSDSILFDLAHRQNQDIPE